MNSLVEVKLSITVPIFVAQFNNNGIHNNFFFKLFQTFCLLHSLMCTAYENH